MKRKRSKNSVKIKEKNGEGKENVVKRNDIVLELKRRVRLKI